MDDDAEVDYLAWQIVCLVWYSVHMFFHTTMANEGPEVAAIEGSGETKRT